MRPERPPCKRSVARPSGRMSHVDMLKKLLEKGADPNVTVVSQEGRFVPGGGLSRNPPDLAIGRHYLTYMGATPFYLAARNGDAEMMRILAAAGANPTTPTKYGVTPLMGAACLDYYEGETAGPFSGVSEAARLEAVKLALELGNDINARTNFGDYPMTGSAGRYVAALPGQYQGPAEPWGRRYAFRSDDSTARGGDLQSAIDRGVPHSEGCAGRREEQAGLDSPHGRKRDIYCE